MFKKACRRVRSSVGSPGVAVGGRMRVSWSVAWEKRIIGSGGAAGVIKAPQLGLTPSLTVACLITNPTFRGSIRAMVRIEELVAQDESSVLWQADDVTVYNTRRGGKEAEGKGGAKEMCVQACRTRDFMQLKDLTRPLTTALDVFDTT